MAVAFLLAAAGRPRGPGRGRGISTGPGPGGGRQSRRTGARRPGGTAAAAARPSAPAAYVPPKQLLALGMHGAAVRALQKRLAALKYYPGPADGQFGLDTLEAVWAFKEVQGLPGEQRRTRTWCPAPPSARSSARGRPRSSSRVAGACGSR